MGRKAIKTALREKEAALKFAEQRIKELQHQLNLKNKEIKDLIATREGKGSNTQASNPAHIEMLQKETDLLQEVIRRKRREIEELKKQLHKRQLEAATYKEKLAISNRRLAENEQKIKQLETQLLEKVSRIQELTNTIEGLRTQIDTKSVELQKIGQQVSSSHEKIREMESALEKKNSELLQTKAALEKAQRQYSDLLASKASEILFLNRKLQEMEGKLAQVMNRNFLQRVKACFTNKF